MGKFKTFEEAQKALAEQKAKLVAAREKRDAFEKANKLRKGQVPDDKKLAKEYTALAGAVKTEKASYEAIETEMKALRPPKEKTTKYNYPEGMSEAEKKKFRAAERRKANGEEGDEKSTKKKAKGGKEKEEAPAEKPSKKDEKVDKKKTAPETSTKKVVKKKPVSKED